MPDASTPLPAGEPAPIPAEAIDPLAGDWSEGLPGPLRALAVQKPQTLALEGLAQAPAAVAAPPAWETATSDPLHSAPPPAEPPLMPSETLGQDAPTPWSEPLAQPAEPVAWLAPPPSTDQSSQALWPLPSEPAQEWQPQAAAPDFDTAQTPQAASLPDAPPADWSTLSSGPDWSAPPEPAPAPDAWAVPPPSQAGPDWLATPAEPPPEAVSEAEAPEAAATEWIAPSASEPEADWSPPPSAPAAAPAWNAPAVGPSALEQLDSEPPEPEPGAAEKLFGSVPAGGSLSGDDDVAGPDVAGPDVLADSEDVLTPLDPHDDPDLPVALDDAEPPSMPLAALRPATADALEVSGEHRVAVHTRGGRTLRGTVRDVNLSRPQFALQPQGGGSTETIYHSDVKVIFFMLPPGEKVKAAEGGHVRVKLSDGRIIEGGRDGADARHGFFLVPGDAARTNTRRIYVARDAADEIEG
jgi:small nuclear ribonucleoprotein (snRNP)-like protein